MYVLHNDIAWQLLPLELGFGPGQGCRRRLERWQQTDAFDQLHRILLAELNAASELDWSRACVDGSHIRPRGGCRHRSVAGRPAQDGRQAPLDLRRPRHPLKVITNAANVNDVTQTLALVDGIPRGRGPAGHAAAPIRCSATRATTPTPTARNCASAGSCRSSPARAPLTSRAWAKSATSSSMTFALLHQFKRLAVR
ncbi:hypothetical protein [Streptomyces sp. SAS_260]|uniref:hypothetical protein n=1 Tax=Streptomyces sp. SAS_260 TaxID=3412751 RepID=UPI00403D36F3